MMVSNVNLQAFSMALSPVSFILLEHVLVPCVTAVSGDNFVLWRRHCGVLEEVRVG